MKVRIGRSKRPFIFLIFIAALLIYYERNSLLPNEFESDQLLQNTSSKFVLHDYIPQPERHEKTDQLNAQVQKNSTLYIICVSVNGKDRRDLIRKYTRTWMSLYDSYDNPEMVYSEITFFTPQSEKNYDENRINKDLVMFSRDELQKYEGNINLNVLLNSLEHAANARNFTSIDYLLTIEDSDLVNFDMIRQLMIRVSTDNVLICFSPLLAANKPISLTANVPSRSSDELIDRMLSRGCAGNKFIMNAAKVKPLWEKFTEIMETKNRENPRVSLTGFARRKVGIPLPIPNDIFRVIVTLPYNDKDHTEWAQGAAIGGIEKWAMDIVPSIKMKYELPDLYINPAEKQWKIELFVKPACPDINQYLSLVKTSRNNFDQRELLRIISKQDLREDKNGSLPLVRFLIGLESDTEDEEISGKVLDEMKKHGDLILGDFIDAYDNLPLKTLSGYTYVNEVCNPAGPKWIMFHDDDALIYPEEAMEYFESGNATDLNCFGFLGDNQRPFRWGKYNSTFEQWDTGYWYPRFCSGPCNGMSRQTAEAIYETATKTDSKGFRLEDVLFTGIIREKAKLPLPTFMPGICHHFGSSGTTTNSFIMHVRQHFSQFIQGSKTEKKDQIAKIMGKYYTPIYAEFKKPNVSSNIHVHRMSGKPSI